MTQLICVKQRLLKVLFICFNTLLLQIQEMSGFIRINTNDSDRGHSD